MGILWYFLIFMLGASLGSFLNVLISRSVEGADWVGGRSHCDSCHKTLQWYDMIPVFTYLLYRGKTRCCGKPLSPQHIVVEGLVGSLFVWWLLVGSVFFRLVSHPFATIQPLFWLAIGLLLMGILIADLFYGLIPSIFVTIGIVLVTIYRLLLSLAGVYQWRDYGLSLVAAASAWAFFWFLRKVTNGRGMGDGDVILAFLIGLVLGWPKMVLWIWISFTLGAVVSVFLILLGRKKMRSTIPFGPFMVVATWITLVWGEWILRLLY